MSRRLTTWALGFLCLAVPRLGEAQEPLRLEEVLKSSLQSHPKSQVADSKVSQAEASQMAADGGFDLKLYATGHYAPLGKYERPRGEVGVKQPTPLLGTELWAKYENGADYAPYDGGLVTSEAGKASLGVLLPLLQGRSTDSRRFERARANLELAIAEEYRRSQRADLLAAAASAWWKWVVSGEKLQVYRKLVEQAEHRQAFLREQEALGAIGRIETVDNDRLVAERRAELVRETLKFQRLSFKLGIYRRGEDGRPQAVGTQDLPDAVAPVEPGKALLNHALSQLEVAPGPKVYEETLKILEGELALAENDQLPRLDFEVYGSQSFGEERPYSAINSSVTQTVVAGSLKFSMPVQRRKARGKAGILRAKQRQIELERKLLIEQLTARAQAEFAALEGQFQTARLSREATQLAGEVATAEAESLALGQSSILSLNLREQATLKSYLAELDSVLGFHLSWVELQRLAGKQTVEAYLPPRGEKK